jgi:hypothetical protein
MNGMPVMDLRKAWAKACTAAGKSGLLFHDLRRPAVTGMLNAKVSPVTAMSISGHNSAAMLKRYAISLVDPQKDAFAARREYEQRKAVGQ